MSNLRSSTRLGEGPSRPQASSQHQRPSGALPSQAGTARATTVGRGAIELAPKPREPAPVPGPVPYAPLHPDEVLALAIGSHQLPHNVLGVHAVVSGNAPAAVVRSVVPGAGTDDLTVVVTPEGQPPQRVPMKRIHEYGVFEALVPFDAKTPYHFELNKPGGTVQRLEDGYRVKAAVTVDEVSRVHNGKPKLLAYTLGANEHTDPETGLKGYRFALWAPNAQGVCLVGDFNEWSVKRTQMSKVGDTGVWQVFVPEISEGAHYKFAVKKQGGALHELHTDPVGKQFELPPGSAALTVGTPKVEIDDTEYRARRAARDTEHEAQSILEVHPHSWRTKPDGAPLNWRELAGPLAEHLLATGYTDLELMGVNYHPYKPSWGYQVTGYFAPDARMGTPDDFRYFIDFMHKKGIPVLFDWVPAHTPKNADVLDNLDGTSLYTHADPRKGEHPHWGTKIFNPNRPEVDAFLRGSSGYMLDAFHGDGVRVDAVASMLWRSYGRERHEAWLNPDGSEQNWDSVAFLRRVNSDLEPHQVSHAEESSDWPKVSHPVEYGGLGFDRKWGMGLMHDFLDAFGKDYPHRRVSELTRVNLWSVMPPNHERGEKYVLAFSHDEVVHGKKSMLMKMPGDLQQKAASLRSFYARTFAYPGDKLNMMGNEFGQEKEWDYDKQLSWEELQNPLHQGIYRAFADANKGFVKEPALHYFKDTRGFMQLAEHDEKGVEAFLRRGPDQADDVMVVTNVSLNPTTFRIPVPHDDNVSGWREVLNTQSELYGGDNSGNYGAVPVQTETVDGAARDFVELKVPANCTLWLKKSMAPAPFVNDAPSPAEVRAITQMQLARAAARLSNGLSEVAPAALARLQTLAQQWHSLHELDVEALANKLKRTEAAALRKAYRAVEALKRKGELDAVTDVTVVSDELLTRLQLGKLGAEERTLLEGTALRELLLVSDPATEGTLRSLAADQLKGSHGATDAELSELRRPDQPLRIENHRRSNAAQVLLANTTLPDELKVQLLVTLGEVAGKEVVPLIKKLTAGSKGAVATAAKASIAAIQKAARMTIVMATMEAKPFCGTGGLGNVMGELPRALARLGHRVIVLTPRHGAINQKKHPLKPFSDHPDDGQVLMPGGAQPLKLMQPVTPDADGVEHYLLEHESFYGSRSRIYNKVDGDYPDNDKRYDYLGGAVPVALRAILKGDAPDVVQINDAHSCSAASYLKSDPVYRAKTKVVLGLHNIRGAYHGKFSPEHLPNVGFRHEYFPNGPAEAYGDINFLKLGMIHADATIPVSRAWGREILDERQGEGLQGVLRMLDQAGRLRGNLNGIEAGVWSSRTDPHIPHHFSFVDRSGKAKNKEALREQFSLPKLGDDVPLVGVVSRITEQKGFDDSVKAMRHALDSGRKVQFVVMGTVEDVKIAESVEALAREYPNNVRFDTKFTDPKEHLVYAGADLFLMPSRFEPSGLPQMYSLRYLTIPIVRAVGGLDESIRDVDAHPNGNGFKFKTDVREAMDRALDWYGKGEQSREPLLRTAALSDFSWESTSAVEQLAIYRRVINGKRL